MQGHEAERLANRRRRRDTDDRLDGRRFRLQHLSEGRAVRVEHLILPHPFVAVQFGKITLAGIAQKRHDAGVRIIDGAGDVERHVRDEPR